jgi:GMP reductase
VVPANMKTVIDEKICIWLAENGYFYVMHRFDLDNVQFVRDMRARGVYASISLGVKAPDYAAVDQMVAEDLIPEYITIDIAHGHADSVKKMVRYLKAKMPTAFVIAGNVATPEAVIDLENWGADATKVGVGPGKVCITKLKTGFGTGGWQLSALKWCARVATKPIIADGGIRSHGDIAKSIRFGATMVMIGSMLAGHEESPGRRWKSMAAVQGVLRLGQRLQQGRVQTRRGQAHPGADQGQTLRDHDRNGAGRPELDQLCRRHASSWTSARSTTSPWAATTPANTC